MFFKAVDAKLLLLIDKLSAIPMVYDNFYMAGGTALALRFGHRKSIDIDLFSKENFKLDDYAQSHIYL